MALTTDTMQARMTLMMAKFDEEDRFLGWDAVESRGKTLGPTMAFHFGRHAVLRAAKENKISPKDPRSKPVLAVCRRSSLLKSNKHVVS